jgi:uroporphyrin-III C-methyltransferase / precorrin-2 dehydrogenase / sirohydrochlorin ferrochelatase
VISPDEPSARVPTPDRPRRMEQLSTLPLFFMLGGRRAVVVGGSEAAAWKAELLSAAGADVEVWDPDPCAEIEVLAADPPGGTVTVVRRTWNRECLAGASIVVAAANDEAEAAGIAAAARNAGAPFNVIDKPAYCSFQFGAIVNRSPLVIGISTEGAAPIFGQAVRSRIEALLPMGFKRWAGAAKRWRADLKSMDLGPQMRRLFWERFTTLALTAPDRKPFAKDFKVLLAEARDEASSQGAVGHVTLVGAGPGDPELLTLKALRALRTADVILFDDLVAPEILDFARREAKRMLVGKTGYGPSCKQDEINTLMVGLAKAGKRVVRLKSGDPLIFGRAGEEIAALASAGIAVNIVPGITAAQGAAASLKVSLTHRSTARRVQFITGHARGGRLPSDLDLSVLADPRATTAVYMPRGTLRELVDRLRKTGAALDQPACAIFNATRPGERVVSGTLATIGDLVEAVETNAPCLLLFGSVLLSRTDLAEEQGGGIEGAAEVEHQRPTATAPDIEQRQATDTLAGP